MDAVQRARLTAAEGMAGSVDRSRRRQVTIIAREAWDRCMAELAAAVDPSARRANVMVEGIELAGSRGRVLRIGEARLLIGGETTPCERMDEAHPGLRRAMRPEWRGGVHARVIGDGWVEVGDAAHWEPSDDTARTPFFSRPVG
jgi:MOSC domain-containing protein YiiM